MSTIEFKYGELFEKAWETIKEDLPLVAGLTIVYGLACAALAYIPFMSFLSTALHPGYLICLLNIKSKKNIELKDFFWTFMNFNRFLHYALCNFIFGFSLVIAFLLLVIPGIYLSIALSLGTTYFVLRKQDAIESFKASMTMISGHWWEMFGLCVLIMMLNLAGVLCLLVGVLVTIPMSALLMVSALELLESKLQAKPVIESDL